MISVKLSNSLEMPLLGYGVFHLVFQGKIFFLLQKCGYQMQVMKKQKSL